MTTNNSSTDKFSLYIATPLACLAYGLIGGWFLLTVFYVIFTPIVSTGPKTPKGKILIAFYYMTCFTLTLFLVYQWVQFAVATEYPGLLYPTWIPHFLF